MKNTEFVAKLKTALNTKTLYVMGCFGAPMNETNKARYIREQSYNQKEARKAKINAATADTFGFDCVCFIKGILWGWNGDKNAMYGGAKYNSNGVPDFDTEEMIARCSSVSKKFDSVEIGELLWTKGHVGVYIGSGLAIECTPSWDDGVQITSCNMTISGYNRRDWTKHGKLPWVEYVKEPVASADENIRQFVKAAIADGFTMAWNETLENLAKRCLVQQWSDGKYRYKNLTYLAQTLMGMTNPDGYCGPNTTAAIKKYQLSVGLKADGGIGAGTWSYLLGVKKK